MSLSIDAKYDHLAVPMRMAEPVGELFAAIILFSLMIHTMDSPVGHGIGLPLVLIALGLMRVVGNVLVPILLVAKWIAEGYGRPAPMGVAVGPQVPSFWWGVGFLAFGFGLGAFHFGDSRDPTAAIFVLLFLLVAAGYCGLRAVVDGVRGLSETAKERLAQADAASHRAAIAPIRGLTLCAGIALGVFESRNLRVGVAHKGDRLLIGPIDAKRGLLCIGPPGTRKTTSVVYPSLLWGLRTEPRAGALIFAAKRKMTDDVLTIVSPLRRRDQIHVIGVGDGRERMNVIAGMSHEAIGDATRDGIGASQSDFWIHGPSSYVEGFVEIAKALKGEVVVVPDDTDDDGSVLPGNEAYDLAIDDTLTTLLKLISADSRRTDALFAHGFALAQKLREAGDQVGNELAELLHSVRDRVLPLMLRDAKLAEEMRQSVLPQFQSFERGAVRRAFCDSTAPDVLALLEQGHVVIIEVDEAEHPRAVATVVRMVFRRIVQMARERTASHRVATNSPIMLVLDEYVNYAAPGHQQGWNTIRESNFVPVVGITSVSALGRQLGGENAANAMLGNFAGKIYFETDDAATRTSAKELIGKSIIQLSSESEGTNTGQGYSLSHHPTGGGGSNTSSGKSSGTSITEHLEEALGAEVWRGLGAGREHARALAFVRTPQGVRTDVVLLGVLDPAERINTAAPESYEVQV